MSPPPRPPSHPRPPPSSLLASLFTPRLPHPPLQRLVGGHTCAVTGTLAPLHMCHHQPCLPDMHSTPFLTPAPAAASRRDRVRESLLRTATLSDRDAPSVAPRVDALTAGQMGTPLGAFVALLAENTLARIAAMDAALANLTELRASAPTDPTAAMLGPAYDNMAAVLERERQLLHATLETVDSMAAAVAHAHSPSGGRRAPVPDGSAQPSAPGMQAVREAVQAFSDRSRELARAMASDDGTAAAPADPVTLPPLSLPSSLPLPSLPLHSPLGALPAPSFAVSLPAFASLTPATGPAGRSAPSHDGSATHHWLPASHLPGPAPVAPASLEEGLRKRLSFGLSPSPFDAAGKGHATAPDREVPFGAIADEIRRVLLVAAAGVMRVRRPSSLVLLLSPQCARSSSLVPASRSSAFLPSATRAPVSESVAVTRGVCIRIPRPLSLRRASGGRVYQALRQRSMGSQEP